MKVPRKLKIELSYDQAVPLLGIHPEKTIIQKVICTLVFIAVLFTITKPCKQAKYPLTNESIKNLWYMCVCHTHTHKYIPAEIPLNHKKNTIMPFAALLYTHTHTHIHKYIIHTHTHK